MKTTNKQTAIQTLATCSRGYATDKQCDEALAREAKLASALGSAYEAMITMRAMLAKADVSIAGSPLNKTIQRTGLILYPPNPSTAESIYLATVFTNP
jgi:hypothetical protein